MITLEEGLSKTWRLPVFSALLIAFKASAKTEVLVIVLYVWYERFWKRSSKFFSSIHPVSVVRIGKMNCKSSHIFHCDYIIKKQTHTLVFEARESTNKWVISNTVILTTYIEQFHSLCRTIHMLSYFDKSESSRTWFCIYIHSLHLIALTCKVALNMQISHTCTGYHFVWQFDLSRKIFQ